jgi:hypothetical protein
MLMQTNLQDWTEFGARQGPAVLDYSTGKDSIGRPEGRMLIATERGRMDRLVIESVIVLDSVEKELLPNAMLAIT